MLFFFIIIHDQSRERDEHRPSSPSREATRSNTLTLARRALRKLSSFFLLRRVRIESDGKNERRKKNRVDGENTDVPNDPTLSGGRHLVGDNAQRVDATRRDAALYPLAGTRSAESSSHGYFMKEIDTSTGYFPNFIIRPIFVRRVNEKYKVFRMDERRNRDG